MIINQDVEPAETVISRKIKIVEKQESQPIDTATKQKETIFTQNVMYSMQRNQSIPQEGVFVFNDSGGESDSQTSLRAI